MKKSVTQLAVASAVVCMFGATAAHAMQPASEKAGADRSAMQAKKGGAIDIVTWDQGVMRQGYSAERLMDMEVKGSKGEEIGDVKDILVDSSGKVTALIVSHGGILGIGDKELRVPFNEVKPDAGLDNLSVPITKDTASKYRIREDAKTTRAKEMKVSELLEDKVSLRGGARYGEVDDIIIGKDGHIKAIVVEDVDRRGRFAFPWIRDAYDAAADRFTYDYERNQIDKLRPFDYSALNIVQPKQRTAAKKGDTGAGGTAGSPGAGTAKSDSMKR